jgi:hypothetical protein
MLARNLHEPLPTAIAKNGNATATNSAKGDCYLDNEKVAILFDVNVCITSKGINALIVAQCTVYSAQHAARGIWFAAHNTQYAVFSIWCTEQTMHHKT